MMIIEPPPEISGSIVDKGEVVPAYCILSIMNNYRVKIVWTLLLLDESCI